MHCLACTTRKNFALLGLYNYCGGSVIGAGTQVHNVTGANVLLACDLPVMHVTMDVKLNDMAEPPTCLDNLLLSGVAGADAIH